MTKTVDWRFTQNPRNDPFRILFDNCFLKREGSPVKAIASQRTKHSIELRQIAMKNEHYLKWHFYLPRI